MLQQIKSLLVLFWWKIDEWLFPVTQRLGFHITKTHFYSPIPNTNELPDSLWKEKYDLSVINMTDETQLELLFIFSHKYKTEYDSFFLHKKDKKEFYYFNNGFFESVDTEILYSMVRHFKPATIFEIGSGFSTFITSKAVVQNEREGHQTKFEAFEPYPKDTLKQKLLSLHKLNIIKAQNIPLSKFQQLKANDILFIDSSHILKIGSDVWYEYLKVLPTLNKGVIVHIHDIFLPEEYPKDWIIKDHKFSNEQYLLYAFLTYNCKFQVLWGSQYMHKKYPDRLTQAFKSYNPELSNPQSFWVKKVG